MLTYILYPCAWICSRQQSPRSAQQDKLSCSVVCRLLLFRPSLKWQDHYHKGQLLPLGNICMSASLSASFPVSICHPFIVLFFFLVFSFPLSFYPTRSFCHSSSLCMVHGKQCLCVAVRNKTGHLYGWSLKGKQRNVFKMDYKLNSCGCVYWCS